jgi:hypothetical protein
VIDADPYLPGGRNWYTNQNNLCVQPTLFLFRATSDPSSAFAQSVISSSICVRCLLISPLRVFTGKFLKVMCCSVLPTTWPDNHTATSLQNIRVEMSTAPGNAHQVSLWTSKCTLHWSTLGHVYGGEALRPPLLLRVYRSIYLCGLEWKWVLHACQVRNKL